MRIIEHKQNAWGHYYATMFNHLAVSIGTPRPLDGWVAVYLRESGIGQGYEVLHVRVWKLCIAIRYKREFPRHRTYYWPKGTEVKP